MKAPIVITDLTRMQGERVCVGGYFFDDTCVRPVFHAGGLMESWLKAVGRVIIRPFAVVEFDFKERKPAPPHTEDRIIDRVYRSLRGLLTENQRWTLLQRIVDPSIAEIFGAPLHQEPGWYVMAGEGARSLGTIIPQEVMGVYYTLKHDGLWNYRLWFRDGADSEYYLSVSDLAFRYFLDDLRTHEQLQPEAIAEHVTAMLQQSEVVLRIGLARGWAKYPDRCFVQITGVYTFPDYLDGRCFDDFAG